MTRSNKKINKEDWLSLNMGKLAATLLIPLLLACTMKAQLFNPGNTFANCVPPNPTAFCKAFLPFRSVDGSCNNLAKPPQGAKDTALARLLPADYVDSNNLDTPRGFPGTLPRVPTAHEVSRAVFRVQTINRQRSTLSTMFMAFGQFLDHDFAYTSHPPCDVSAGCGSITAFTYPCFPLIIRSGGSRCTSLARSVPVCQPKFQPRTTREQLNIISSFVDLSQVYSNDIIVHKQLRTVDGNGLLKVTSSNLLPIRLPPSDPECRNPGGCSLVGDDRGDENIVLNTLHTIFVRYHNYIAKKLKVLTRSTSEKFLFETARKINIAIYQRIVYNEFLPPIVDLAPYKGYDTSVDASITNVFSTAAFRFGHSLVPNAWAQLNNNFDTAFNDISLQASFENTLPIRNRGIEPTAFGLLANRSQVVDTTFAFGIARRLLVPLGERRLEDLTALNIQRGRDHGLKTYGAWRRRCRLPAINTFEDLVGIMSNSTIRNFETVYNNPNDIDIFAAGIAERRTNGKMLGPTFQCIQKIQFERFRDGDRFWYENPGVFTPDQLIEINKMTLSKVLCNTLKGIVSIQRNALRAVFPNTVRRGCGNIPDIDLKKWINFWIGSIQITYANVIGPILFVFAA
ncbi:lactoperoxidase-like [Hydractinia symbiolongicarpus]|uniref:lactoperoxidase-like n=1 Tax=Hydractinia symbiolongicarpus TaxID=13093 RepID=UPI00254FB0CD|nr:lactoperoxidase-like [Hydractinia symbiolongicarpus]